MWSAEALESRAFSVNCGVAQSGCSLRVFRRGGVRDKLDRENNQVLGATVLCSAGGEGYEPTYVLEWSLGQLFGA